jgi:tRNA(fMet)-specific endonuclease VapC
MSDLLMLDTNALSAVMKARSTALDERLANERFCISVVTEAEIRFGLARRPDRAQFRTLAEGVLGRIDIRPWTSATARRCGPLRVELTSLGKPLAPLDLMIAAHALAEGATLITADRAFAQVPGLTTQGYEKE